MVKQTEQQRQEGLCLKFQKKGVEHIMRMRSGRVVLRLSLPGTELLSNRPAKILRIAHIFPRDCQKGALDPQGAIINNRGIRVGITLMPVADYQQYLVPANPGIDKYQSFSYPPKPEDQQDPTQGRKVASIAHCALGLLDRAVRLGEEWKMLRIADPRIHGSSRSTVNIHMVNEDDPRREEMKELTDHLSAESDPSSQNYLAMKQVLGRFLRSKR